MKKMILLIAILALSTSIFANTREEAAALYADRGSDVENAMEAAKIYEALAAEATDVLEKADLLYLESEARYYYGTNLNGYWPMDIEDVTVVPDELKDERMVIHKTAYEKLEGIMDELRALPESPERNRILAQVIFFYGANLGKWGENNGPIASLGQWGKLKNAMNEIKALGQLDLEAQGSYRILGRGYFKLASLPGYSYKKAASYLKRAYSKSLNADGTASVHGLNNLFYAEALIKTKKKNEARKVLEGFIAVDAETLYPGRIPETKVEIEFAKKLLDTL